MAKLHELKAALIAQNIDLQITLTGAWPRWAAGMGLQRLKREGGTDEWALWGV